MSKILIQQYLNELSDLRRVSGTVRETVVREAFKGLLKGWARSRELIFIPEYEYITAAKQRRYVDGALLYELRVPFGYWEAKDEKDDLDDEIETKFRRGYPQDNIIFEDSREAVLIQHGEQVIRCDVDDVEKLAKLLELFFGYERTEIAQFRRAVEQFKTDLPAVLIALRDMIADAHRNAPSFRAASSKFLKHAQETINPSITEIDVREMLIQHVLTEEIFSKVFDESDFHRRNNVARELYRLEETFFTGGLKKKTLKGLESYYAAIRAAAAQISSHREKQTFLKVIYENFYKIYNKKAADRLGVVYTPNEIVRFMIESADRLCQQHFQKQLIDRNVEILDPASGTGTFVTELIEHFRGQPGKLKQKYLEELHANEVAILPYYVANLNIEATYAAIAGEYEEFPNLCFVDTLDNVAALKKYVGQMGDLFGSVSEENVERIRRQNKRKISVVIGNPPYNANQLNENENNKNREYEEIDRRIRGTYVKNSDSHKTKTYDMYVRFVRWASDRVAENGIVAFVTNRSFIDKRAFDGFRKCLTREFSDIYILDLGGDAREGEVRNEGNVFEIRVGVAISFLVKKGSSKSTTVRLFDGTKGQRDDKLALLDSKSIEDLSFQTVAVPSSGDWAEIDRDEFKTFLPLTIPKLSGKKRASDRNSIFRLASFGCVSNRDDWVYDFDDRNLEKKVRRYISVYNEEMKKLPANLPPDWESKLNYEIKWTQDMRRKAENRVRLSFSQKSIIKSMYRPFVKKFYYYNSDLNWSLYRMPQAYPNGQGKNRSIFFSDRGARAPFSVFAVDRVAELHLCASTDGFQSVSMYEFVEGEARDNITDWGLKQFQLRYEKGSRGGRSITREAIFNYVYGVLHDPVYRAKYSKNLRGEFPRVPLYRDFWKWSEWGQTLMQLHINYETVPPLPLGRVDVPDSKSGEGSAASRAVLRADADKGTIQIDGETVLTGIPPEAWEYKLGKRAALEWVLDQYKEKSPRDPTVAEKFHNYSLADYKEEVIDLLSRVARVSVKTADVLRKMRLASDLR